MDIQMRYFQIFKLALRAIQHRIHQYFLKTDETCIVNTNYGKVQGLKRRVAYEYPETYFSFEGIPYAKPPLGELKFRASQPPEPWQGIRYCTSSMPKAMQRNVVLHIAEGSEDCLYLNIYVKRFDTVKPLPVMVWLHGGGYQIGEISRDLFAPDYFMKKNVIIVSIAYRLGPLGFISFKDPEVAVPGNAGLKDIVLALRWVKENIGNFNGDANNITLFGESAGSASVHLMMVSDKAKGLFHKAIMQSGACDGAYAIQTCRDFPYRMAVKLGYTGSNTDIQVHKFLSEINPKMLYSFKSLLSREEECELMLISFGPVIEPYITKDCVLPKDFHTLEKESWAKDLPLILGITSFEGLYGVDEVLSKPYILDELGNCDVIVPKHIKTNQPPEKVKEVALKIKKTFFGDKEPSCKETFNEYLDMFSYWLVSLAVYQALKVRMKNSSEAPTYLYRFDFDSSFYNHFRILKCGPNVRGVCHGDDISYLFFHCLSENLPKKSMEYKTITRMIDMWTSFAASSNPNCRSIEPTKWKPVNAEKDVFKCLNISDEVKFIDFPDIHKYEVFYDV